MREVPWRIEVKLTKLQSNAAPVPRATRVSMSGFPPDRERKPFL